MLDDASIWQLYTKILTGWAEVPAQDVFSVAALNTFSDLGNPNLAINNWALYQLGDSIPATTGTYSPRSSLFAAYWVYLSYRLQALAPMPGLLVRSTTQPTIDFDHYRQLLRTLLPSAAQANRALSVDLPTVAKALNDLHLLFNEHFAARAPTLYLALDRCRRAALQEPSELNMPCANTSLDTARCPAYALAQWPQMLADWRYRPALSFFGNPRLKLFDRMKVGLLPTGAFGLRQSSTQPTFIGLKAAATPLYTSVGLSLDMERFGSFALKPAAWFEPALLNQTGAQLPANAPDFFGNQGAMGLLPCQAVIGFKPNLILHASTQTQAERLADTVTRIGPFQVKATATLVLPPGAPGSSGEVDIHFDTRDSDMPVLLGVISRRPLG